MRCAEIRDELTALADGELRAGEAGAVEQHLGACAACSGELEELRATVTLTRAALADELPVLRPGFDTRLRARLADLQPAPRRWWRPALVGALAAAGVLLMSRSVGGPSAVLVPLGIQSPPRKVAEKPALFKDYEIIEHLDELENFETVIQTPLEQEITGETRGAG